MAGSAPGAGVPCIMFLDLTVAKMVQLIVWLKHYIPLWNCEIYYVARSVAKMRGAMISIVVCLSGMPNSWLAI